jgi:diacylglycerol O-acyltransferase
MPKRRGTTLLAVDAARLHMSVPHNPMVITAALVMAGRLSLSALLELFEQRLLPHERFRLRVVEPTLGLGAPRWEDDPAFDLRAHVRREELGSRTLEALIGAIASAPLDPKRPLWAARLVDTERGSVVIMRIHHCIADGSALIALLEGLADAPPSQRSVRPSHRFAPRPRPSLRARLAALARGTRSALGFLLQRSEPRTVLSRRLGREKRAALSSAFPLNQLVDIAHRRDTTVTVVVLGAVAGALSALVRPRSRALVLHALVPVSLRREGYAELGNRYASVFVPLPIAEPSAELRVRVIDRALEAARAEGALAAGRGAVLAAGVTLAAVEHVAVALFSRGASVVVSSVRGPEQRVSLAGVVVEDVLVWAPAPGSIPLSVSLMSYAGRVRLGVLADARVVPDPRAFVLDLERELCALPIPSPPGACA